MLSTAYLTASTTSWSASFGAFGVCTCPGSVGSSANWAEGQGGVLVSPGSGGGQGGVLVSPANADRPKTQVRTNAAPIFLRFFMFFSLTTWLLICGHRERHRDRGAFKKLPRLVLKIPHAQAFYRVYRKAGLR